jgi:hypothetical protein
MEENRRTRNKTTQLQPSDLLQVKDSLFNKQWWKNWLSTCRRLKLDLYLSSCTKINYKWIEDLDVRFKTLKLLQDKIGKTLEYKVIGNYFLNRASIAQETWTMLDKWDCIKLKVSEHYQKKQLVESRENSQNGKKNLLQLFNRDGINIQIHNELKKTK